MQDCFISHIKNGIAAVQVQPDRLFTIHAISTYNGQVDWDWVYRVRDYDMFSALGFEDDTLTGISATIMDHFDSYSDSIELNLGGLEFDPDQPFLDLGQRVDDDDRIIIPLEQVYFTLADSAVTVLLLEHVREHICDQLLNAAITEYVQKNMEPRDIPSRPTELSLRGVLRRIWEWCMGVDESHD
jgi:hypothetical protein